MISKSHGGGGIGLNNNKQYTYILTRALRKFESAESDPGPTPSEVSG